MLLVEAQCLESLREIDLDITINVGYHTTAWPTILEQLSLIMIKKSISD